MVPSMATEEDMICTTITTMKTLPSGDCELQAACLSLPSFLRRYIFRPRTKYRTTFGPRLQTRLLCKWKIMILHSNAITHVK